MGQSPLNPTSSPPYEAPRIDAVLDAEDVAREVHYAGTTTGD